MDDTPLHRPRVVTELRSAGTQADFTMSCDERTGCLLATLAAARPGGRFLELGTGAGVGTAWLLSGMPADARLVTVESNADYQAIAETILADDNRVEFVNDDGGTWLDGYSGPGFDLIFADTWPGKFTHLDRALDLVRLGGLYVIDDLLPQSNWPRHHHDAVDHLVAELGRRPDFRSTQMDWSSGLLIAARMA